MVMGMVMVMMMVMVFPEDNRIEACLTALYNYGTDAKQRMMILKLAFPPSNIKCDPAIISNQLIASIVTGVSSKKNALWNFANVPIPNLVMGKSKRRLREKSHNHSIVLFKNFGSTVKQGQRFFRLLVDRHHLLACENSSILQVPKMEQKAWAEIQIQCRRNTVRKKYSGACACDQPLIYSLPFYRNPTAPHHSVPPIYHSLAKYSISFTG